MLMVTPSTTTVVAAALPFASQSERASAAPLRRPPSTPESDAMRARCSRPMKRGSANAARMPRMTITTTSSMSVKPRCLDCFINAPTFLRSEGKLAKPSAADAGLADHFPQRQEDAERQHQHHAADEHDQDGLDRG